MAGIDGNTKLMLHMDDAGLTDSSDSNHTTTENASMGRSAVESKFGGYSANFTAGYLDVTGSSDFEVGTGDFTVDMWINTTVNSIDTYYRRVFLWDGPTGNANNNPQLAMTPTSGFLNAWSNTGSLDIYSTTPVDDGEWHHIALVRSSGTVYLFVDGVSEANVGYAENINISTPSPRFGSFNTLDGNYNGYIDEARVSNTDRGWTSTFTPPTSAYSDTPYKVSGELSEAARIIVIKESDWSILDNDTHSTGAYEIDLGESDPGEVLVAARKSDGEAFVYGNITPILS